MKPFSLLLPLLLLAAPPRPQTQETVADEPPSNLARTASQLRRFTVDDYETTVPPAVRPLLTTFKTEIRDLVGWALSTSASRLRTNRGSFSSWPWTSTPGAPRCGSGSATEPTVWPQAP